MAGKDLRFRIYFSCWTDDKGMAEKNHIHSFAPLVFVLGEERPERSWSRNKFYSISVNRKKQNHPIVLGISPEVISVLGLRGKVLVAGGLQGWLL